MATSIWFGPHVTTLVNCSVLVHLCSNFSSSLLAKFHGYPSVSWASSHNSCQVYCFTTIMHICEQTLLWAFKQLCAYIRIACALLKFLTIVHPLLLDIHLVSNFSFSLFENSMATLMYICLWLNGIHVLATTSSLLSLEFYVRTYTRLFAFTYIALDFLRKDCRFQNKVIQCFFFMVLQGRHAELFIPLMLLKDVVLNWLVQPVLQYMF